MEAAPEQAGNAHRRSGDGSEPGAGEVPGCVRCAVAGWITVSGDFLAGDSVEKSVAMMGDDHDQVASIVRVDGEADAQQAADGRSAVQHRLPGARGRHDGSSQIALAQPLLILRDQHITLDRVCGLSEKEFREQWEGLDHLADKIYGYVEE